MLTKDSLWCWFVTDGYIWDWLAAAIGIIINHVVPEFIHVTDRHLTPGDPTLSYPYKSNTVSSAVLYVLTFAWPGLVFILVALYRKSFADGHHALLSLAEGFALACGWKRWMNMVGRYRPNWFALVVRDGSTSDGRLAYPSGHSCYMFFSGTILALFLLGKLRVFAGPSQALFVKFNVCLMPLWLSTYVACSRLTDYKHDFSDVNAGCFIGIATGLLAYFLNYPSLFSHHCQQPRLRSRDSALHSGDTLARQTSAYWPRDTGGVKDGHGVEPGRGLSLDGRPLTQV